MNSSRLDVGDWMLDVLQSRASILALRLPLLLLLTLPAAVQAQFNYVITNGTITITGYTGPGGAVSIPETINGLPVTRIGSYAFWQRSDLAHVTIGNSVTTIGDWAFFLCTNLMSVAMGNSVAYIGSEAFNSCISLTNVTIGNSVTNIADFAFYHCAALTTITIPNKVRTIGWSSFGRCTNLTNATIGNSVTRIGKTAFESCASLNTFTIPDSVTSIGGGAFFFCTGLTNITIPKSVTSIESPPFTGCTRLQAITVDALNPVFSSIDGILFNKNQMILIQYPGGRSGSYTLPGSVMSIGDGGFSFCSRLTSVTIPGSVNTIGQVAFAYCTNLTSVYCLGNAPEVYWYAFAYDYQDFSVHYINATIYYLPGTTGWTPTLGNLPTAVWIEVPTLQTSPQAQTAEAGSAVCLWAHATNSLPVTYLWYLNGTNFISCSTNGELELTNVQFAQSGPYTVVVSNALGAVTSAAAVLNVIPPVERRWVPALILLGQPGSALNLDATEALVAAPNWAAFDSVLLTNPSQWYFDLSEPLPPQRFYRAWQGGAPVVPALDARLIPALTLTGSVGSAVRVDGINQIGPTDAWFPVDTVTLTNASQLYFDVSVIGQPPRLWRLVQVP